MHTAIKLQKRNGKLVNFDARMQLQMDEFVSHLPEGGIAEVYFEELQDDGTVPQIRKVHKLFRIMSEHSGYTVEEIKILVKESCGLAYKKIIEGEQYIIPIKSIGDMSKRELAILMEGTIRFGEEHFQMVLD